MSAHFQSSGPRGNAYSVSKFTNWTVYDPFFAEARSALKRFGGRLASKPAFPRVVALPPLAPDFFHPAKLAEVERRLHRMPAEHLTGLRAVFLLSGTRKERRSWNGSLGCYGIYWNGCIFLCAHPFELGRHNLDTIRDFYLNEVLVHEVAHHVDRFRVVDQGTREAFAHAFVQQGRA